MFSGERNIQFICVYEKQEYEIKSFKDEYRNLMVLLRENIFLDNFGECGGMGRCGTCMIKLNGIANNAALSNRNEHSTLKKMGIVDSEVRLSCQIQINDELNGAEVEIMGII